METIAVTVKDKIAIVTLNRGKANAINAQMVTELQHLVKSIESDDLIAGMIITGKEGFFSAGLDLVELYDYNETEIKKFWNDFLSLVSTLAAFKKPFISAINGHSPAGGCVIAICSDYRIMAEGKYIIGLNEVPVGIIVPDSIFHLYSFWIGKANAYRFLLEGKLLTPDEALQTGLVDEVVRTESILTIAERQIRKYVQLNAQTWQQSKTNLRKELIDKVNADQTEMLETMLKQWWSPATRSILKTIITNLKPQ